MKKIYVLNGPNLNMLGIREPEQYGNESYAALEKKLKNHAKENSYKLVTFQSNHEGELIDKIHEAYFKEAFGIVINPGAYTHTSIALLDAIKAVMLPTVEVHISDVERREVFRQTSYVREACIKTISGHGFNGYIEAIDYLLTL